jgi:hypothetical protein
MLPGVGAKIERRSEPSPLTECGRGEEKVTTPIANLFGLALTEISGSIPEDTDYIHLRGSRWISVSEKLMRSSSAAAALDLGHFCIRHPEVELGFGVDNHAHDLPQNVVGVELVVSWVSTIATCLS